jgi:hypothetical protein
VRLPMDKSRHFRSEQCSISEPMVRPRKRVRITGRRHVSSADVLVGKRLPVMERSDSLPHRRGNARSNRTTVCVAHHLHSIHEGVVRAWGIAPDAIHWQLGVRADHAPLLDLVGDFYISSDEAAVLR